MKKGKGLVKEYYYNGYLRFEGEYLNWKRNGKGKGKEYISSILLYARIIFKRCKKWKR